jgi:hypothetical protein
MSTLTQQFNTNLRNEVYRLIKRIKFKLESNKEESARKIEQRLLEIEKYLEMHQYDIKYASASRDWLEKVIDAC